MSSALLKLLDADYGVIEMVFSAEIAMLPNGSANAKDNFYDKKIPIKLELMPSSSQNMPCLFSFSEEFLSKGQKDRRVSARWSF